MAARKGTNKKATVVEEDDIELEELDAEVDDDDDEEDEAPAKAKKAKVEDNIWGVRQLCDYIMEKTGKEYNPREMRNLLRKMAREENARIDREIVAGNKARYEWSGPKDDEVKRIIAAVKGGEIEDAKKEALDKLKADKAKRDATKAKKTNGNGKKAKKAAAADDDDDEDDD